jgi:hypothetical protein
LSNPITEAKEDELLSLPIKDSKNEEIPSKKGLSPFSAERKTKLNKVYNLYSKSETKY